MAEDNKNSYSKLKDLQNDLAALNGFPQQIEDKANQANSLMKNGKFHDDYADFTEFEDENGNILLIKYDKQEYEFRGNKYCSYILCNEKTGSREEGIAQIKGGQYVRLTDPERVEKIKSYINEQNRFAESTISLVSKLKEIGICPSDTAIVDYAKSISNYVTSRAEYNGDTYLLFIRNKFFTEKHTYVVFNATKWEVVEDETLINKLFDLSKYFSEENKSTPKAKPWWKKW